MRIYGAGIAGLLAGCTFQTARIYEAGPESNINHKALLRFKTSAVGDSVGIDFRKVKVHKGIWDEMCGYQQLSIKLANQYSMKVIGKLADRSIWNLEPCDRFIAPEEFIDMLIDRCYNRIHWSTPITKEDFEAESDLAISTLPMSVMAKFVDVIAPKFEYAPIHVKRWRVPNADVFQTIYIPDPDTSVYRVSITGDLMIAEYVNYVDQIDEAYDVFAPFGLRATDCTPLESNSQRFGKIAPIDDAWRKEFIFQLTSKHKIFSLGRFGTWRNLLLDDVIKDIAVIKKLMNTTTYDRTKIFSK